MGHCRYPMGVWKGYVSWLGKLENVYWSEATRGGVKEPKSSGASNLTMVYVSCRALSPVHRSWIGFSVCPFCTEDQELEVVGMYGSCGHVWRLEDTPWWPVLPSHFLPLHQKQSHQDHVNIARWFCSECKLMPFHSEYPAGVSFPAPLQLSRAYVSCPPWWNLNVASSFGNSVKASKSPELWDDKDCW